MSEPAPGDALRAGLCGRCRHREWLRGPRSSFLRCLLSDTDPRFPRYPRLPVIACAGFRPAKPETGTGAPVRPGG